VSVSREALDRLNAHWAVAAIPVARRERALEVARLRLVHGAIGRQLAVDVTDRTDDAASLEKAAMAYELAAIEGIDALLHPGTDSQSVQMGQQAQAGAFRAYELLRALPAPPDDYGRVFHVLHHGALAYCSDHWTDLRRWLRENPELGAPPSAASVTWDRRVLFRLYDCWIRLFRKNQWDDLDGVREIVAGLREDQRQHEAALLDARNRDDTQSIAYRLVALYHWAKATESLAIYMLQGEPPSIDTELDQHLESARRAVQAAGDASLDVILRWLHVASHRMVASSVWWVARKVNSRVTRYQASPAPEVRRAAVAAVRTWSESGRCGQSSESGRCR